MKIESFEELLPSSIFTNDDQIPHSWRPGMHFKFSTYSCNTPPFFSNKFTCLISVLLEVYGYELWMRSAKVINGVRRRDWSREEKLGSGLDFGRRLLSVEDIGFSGYGYIWVVGRCACVWYDVEMPLYTALIWCQEKVEKYIRVVE